MIARRLAAALLAGTLSAGLSGCLLPPDAPTVLASAGGTGPDDAYVVSSVAQEYEILRLLGLQSQSQEVHRIDGRTFDVLRVIDPQTQEARDVWFDISRFFGRG
ncbi:hypothetical protein GCM10009127_15280 [Alteraurantiacibacter aestuarii]|uniref:Uncharacterized protein n=1 Tax=Alteraurantiacibacter aestuarii TaxID=650004 RepID=A0A844ZJC3_9SPHN|nr:DUF4919 domain-containing protein [Alteraurantiacibacter aestuarii]MXO87885.1 hypothetical protein [Alteraurantiacibacter aestuarii]